MFSRLKTVEEERRVDTLKAYAIRTSRHDVKRFLGRMAYRRIPPHLKRIKSQDDVLLVLVDLIQDHDPICRVTGLIRAMVGDGFWSELPVSDPMSLVEVVEIPRHQPHTTAQYTESSLLWPCIRSHRGTDGLDMAHIERMANILISRGRDVEFPCCGVCIIADGDRVVSLCSDTDDVLGHSILKAVEEVSKAQISYLCTGLDAFILREPCLSCSMAFVHGRIKRVFCIESSPEGPFSAIKINYNKSLNHRYPVYFLDKPDAE